VVLYADIVLMPVLGLSRIVNLLVPEK